MRVRTGSGSAGLLMVVAAQVAGAATNLLANGGFDLDSQLSGWSGIVSPQPADSQATWNADDAGADPASGSLQLDGSTIGDAGSACFEVAPDAPFSFGGQSKSVGLNAALIYADCWTYSDTVCYQGKAVLTQVQMPAATGWTSLTPTNGIVPASARSARCGFFIFPQDSVAPGIAVRFDNVFFNSTLVVIFQNGFEDAAAAN